MSQLKEVLENLVIFAFPKKSFSFRLKELDLQNEHVIMLCLFGLYNSFFAFKLHMELQTMWLLTLLKNPMEHHKELENFYLKVMNPINFHKFKKIVLEKLKKVPGFKYLSFCFDSKEEAEKFLTEDIDIYNSVFFHEKFSVKQSKTVHKFQKQKKEIFLKLNEMKNKKDIIYLNGRFVVIVKIVEENFDLSKQMDMLYLYNKYAIELLMRNYDDEKTVSEFIEFYFK